MTDIARATFSGAGLDQTQLTRLVDLLPVLVWSTDEELRLTSRYGGGLAFLGPVPGPAEGLRVGDVEAPTEAARAVKAHRAALRGEATTYEVCFRGRTFSARVEPLCGPDGRICGVAGICFDITDQQALRESEARLQLVTRATNDAVWDWDLVTNALWWGHGFESLFGYTLEEIEPGIESWYNRIHPEDRERVSRSIRAAIDEGGVSWSGEYRFCRRDGSYADVYDRGYVIHTPQGTPVRMVGSMMDVSDRKRYESKVQASRAALRLLATRHQNVREGERTRIAREIHDSLGQALTALKLQLAALQDAAAKEGSPLASRLCETALMVDDMVKGVRRIATELRPPILDELGLPAAVEWLAHDFARRTGIACRAATVLPNDSAIAADAATALFRIVQEALTNVSRHAGATRVHIELGVKSECVTLEITDDGHGITEVAATGPGSLGILGMRERAAALGGVLEVGPATGGGTRVAAWLPPPARRAKRRPPRSAP